MADTPKSFFAEWSHVIKSAGRAPVTLHVNCEHGVDVTTCAACRDASPDGIVAALANCDPVQWGWDDEPDGVHFCHLCCAEAPATIAASEFRHTDACPWQRAVAWVKP